MKIFPKDLARNQKVVSAVLDPEGGIVSMYLAKDIKAQSGFGCVPMVIMFRGRNLRSLGCWIRDHFGFKRK
jgi:hypothetical protein